MTMQTGGIGQLRQDAVEKIIFHATPVPPDFIGNEFNFESDPSIPGPRQTSSRMTPSV